MKNLNLNIEKTLEFLLGEQYRSEFEIIDRQNQHPEGWTFYDWLFKKELISKEKYEECLKEISEMED